MCESRDSTDNQMADHEKDDLFFNGVQVPQPTQVLRRCMYSPCAFVRNRFKSLRTPLIVFHVITAVIATVISIDIY